MQLFHAAALGVCQPDAEIKQWAEHAENADCNGEKGMIENEPPKNRAGDGTKARQQPVHRLRYPCFGNQSAALLFQTPEPCKRRPFSEPDGPGLFPALEPDGKRLIQTADQKNSRARKQEHGEAG
ncbi:hypothetical protein SDC9_177900 [bioreactor metagenome]|uniref:Uncharacterized protein n=1 Tax=bioreactor metagenome TaxID=1076179 RepID=A0A645GXD3_9ZZZZ